MNGLKLTGRLCALFLLACVAAGAGAEPNFISADGVSHSVRVREGEDGCEIFYSFRLGAFVSAGERVAGGVSINAPAVAAEYGGRVLAAWTDVAEGVEGVFVSERTSEGWSEPLRISAAKPFPAILPSFFQDEGGGFCISYLGYNGNEYVTRIALRDGDAWIAEEYSPARARPALVSAAVNLNKYVGFGDSITSGYTKETGWSGEGYKPRLEELLKSRNPDAFVVLRGWGGERTSVGVNRIDSVLAEERPGHILILEGINDIQGQVSYETILFNLSEMARKSREFGAVPVVGTLAPRADGGRWIVNTEEFNNNYLRPYLKESGVLYADFWLWFMAQRDWRDYIETPNPNGQHPNAAGYELMAECWFDALYPSSSGDCFIAGAAYGADSFEVGVLRTFRDGFLMGNTAGRLFVNAYYRVSPALAEAVKANSILRFLARAHLEPVVKAVGLLTLN